MSERLSSAAGDQGLTAPDLAVGRLSHVLAEQLPWSPFFLRVGQAQPLLVGRGPPNRHPRVRTRLARYSRMRHWLNLAPPWLDSSRRLKCVSSPSCTSRHSPVRVPALLLSREADTHIPPLVADRAYRPGDRSLGTSQWKAFLHVLNHQDLLYEIIAGSKYLWAKIRGREPDATRDDDLEHLTGGRRDEPPLKPAVKPPSSNDSAKKHAMREMPKDRAVRDTAEHQQQRLSSRRPTSPDISQLSEADRISLNPMGRVSRLRARYENLPFEEPQARQNLHLVTDGWSALFPNLAARSPFPHLTDMPRLQPPRGPNAPVGYPMSCSETSICASYSPSERGTFGHRQSSNTGVIDSHPRDASADSLHTARSQLDHLASVVHTSRRQSARLSLYAPSLSEVITSIGLPCDAHLPSAGGTVRTIILSPSDASLDLLQRDSRFPRFISPASAIAP